MVTVIYLGCLMFALNGILFVAAINKYTHAMRMLREVRQMATRVLLINKRN